MCESVITKHGSLQISISSINLIEMKIRQANAIVNLLISDGQGTDGFESSHHLIVSSIGIITDLLNSAYIELLKLHK